ncbi:MAG: tRNA (guanosine(37)-N1)-methyltransferase TrmD [Candidatus Dormibacteraeota bacterium]|nr:tRNA (guanosine(37)-N1)-methyltransferase TrmD [Candidatus Dormibacteraeota bacterium]
MRFDVVTVFPDLFEPMVASGVVGRAIARGLLELHAHDLREHTQDRHRQVDDIPYGGGPGMVLKPEPVFAAVESIRLHNSGPVILLEPWGERFNQELARELAAEPGLILVCGRYEGIDDRVRHGLGAREVSIGDYVLTGGELPALVVIDAVARLQPGVLGTQESLVGDSFPAGAGTRVGHPQYTRPAEFRGLQVPEVLLSGNHREIESWRRAQSERRTKARVAAAHLEEETR